MHIKLEEKKHNLIKNSVEKFQVTLCKSEPNQSTEKMRMRENQK